MLSMALLDEPLSRYSVSIQSMNQWLLIRFRGVTMLFLFVVTSSLALWGLCAPAWQRHHLLRWRKREMGRQELGEGDHREGLSRLFLVVPCCIAFRCAVVCIHKCKHLCCHVSIFVWPCDGKEICSKGAQFVKYVSAKSVCVWFFLCMSIPGCFCYYQSLLFFLPVCSIQKRNWEMKEHDGKERHLQVMKAPKFPSIHYTRKKKSSQNYILSCIW